MSPKAKESEATEDREGTPQKPWSTHPKTGAVSHLPHGEAKSSASLGTVLVLAAGLLVQACTTREIIGVIIGSVAVSPGTASLLEGDVLTFSAIVEDDRGVSLSGAVVSWSVDDPDLLSIGADGRVEALRRGTATVRAEFRGMSGTATVTVIPTPEITVTPADVSFLTGVGDPPPPPAVLDIVNGGTGTLTGLTVTVQYFSGEPTDWLNLSLAGVVAPTTLTVAPQTAGLAVGQFSATVFLFSPDDRNSPFIIPVSLSRMGVTLTESGGGTVVDEAGAMDDFTVALASEPASDVVLTVTSGDPGEATVAPSVLTFTPSDWSTPQTVTVTGADDLIADGDQLTAITVSVDDAASDDAFDPLEDQTVIVSTTDDEVAGFTVAATDGGTTVSEAGGTDEFTVVLDTEPVANVVLNVRADDAGETSVSPATLTFTPANWNDPQTVTVTGVDDDVIDGSQVTTVTVSVDAAASDDALDAVLAESVDVTTTDDDVAGFTIVDTNGSTQVTEGGSTDSVTVVLDAEPLSDVVMTVTSGDTNEATVSPPLLIFTPAGWDTPQTVRITGVDDDVIDGPQVTGITVSVNDADSDDDFEPVADQVVNATTTDDDVAGFTVVESGGATSVTEAGSTDDFTVVLDARPQSNVVLDVVSDDTGEATVSPATLTFTTANWNDPQTVTVTGVDDQVDDGDQQTDVTVVTDNGLSDDDFDGLSETVDVKTTNDDGVGFTILEIGSTIVTEAGSSDVFAVELDTEPAAGTVVVIDLSSSDLGEVTVSPPSLTFTPLNWDTAQVVNVTGVDDSLVDGNQVTQVDVVVDDPASDPDYGAVPDQSVSATTLDDDGALTGRVFEDIDGNGIQNGAEPGIVSVDVIITDGESGVTTVTTDGVGDWIATPLPVGNATVNIDDATLPAGATLTTASDPNVVAVVAGQTLSAGNDGYQQLQGTLTGHIYEDEDGDGKQDGGELGLEDVDVVVTNSLGVARTVTTDASGDWTAAGLPPGPASADVDDRTLPKDFVQTQGSDPTVTIVVAGAITYGGTDGYRECRGKNKRCK